MLLIVDTTDYSVKYESENDIEPTAEDYATGSAVLLARIIDQVDSAESVIEVQQLFNAKVAEVATALEAQRADQS